MIRPALRLLLACAAAPVAAQDTDLRTRLRALAAPVAPADPYAEERSADLAAIDTVSDRLFGPGGTRLGPQDAPVRIVLFVAQDCPDCTSAEADLAQLAERLGVGAKVLTVDDDAEATALLSRLSLDRLPSYVTPKTLIRGPMPAFVLERYVTD
ncbi:hypothetical protein [Tropicibacter sp. S64]|uniref:hypothetical protein n=1 Tax=Tropicibacter sp. S64 TaxID=3415122 RepID=UPI003C7C2B65